jgi:hypothetical protein
VNNKVFWICTGSVLLLFTWLVIVSNQNDWDHFYSFFEVEYRSWLLDKRPPLWTYQLCSGVTRIGDPQSFGLSPLFLFVILFGSFWGAKAIVLFSTFVGIFYLSKILHGWLPLQPKPGRQVSISLSIFFFLGSYFLWHFHVGHLTFSLIPLLVPIFYFVLKSSQSKLSSREYFLFFLLVFTFLTSGFYHAFVFFLLPLLIAGLGFLSIKWLQGQKPRFLNQQFFLLGAAFFIAILLSSYKWYAVLKYQGDFPRRLGDIMNHPPESAFSFAQLLMFQFSPTREFDFVAQFSDWGPWYIWEYASFSAVSFLLVLFALSLLADRIRWKLKETLQKNISEIVFSFILFLFLLGDDSLFSLHRILNDHLFSHSTRSIGRYNILLQVLFLLATIKIISLRPQPSLRVSRLFLPLGFLLTMVNLLTFVEITPIDPLIRILRLPKVYARQMTEIQLVKPRDLVDPHASPFVPPESYMYPAILLGKMVPNCYQPMNRIHVLSGEEAVADGVEIKGNGSIDLIEPNEKLSISKACRDSIFLTQNSIFIDPKLCPKEICLRINSANIYEKPLVSLDPTGWKYCLY